MGYGTGFAKRAFLSFKTLNLQIRPVYRELQIRFLRTCYCACVPVE